MSLFHSRLSTARPQLLPVASYPSQVLLWRRLREAQAKAVLFVGSTLCFLLRLFSLSEVVHRTPLSSRPAPKSLWSHPPHSSPFLNLEMVSSFFDSEYQLTSLHALLLVHLPLHVLTWGHFSWTHDSHLKDVCMLAFIIFREICSNEVLNKYALSRIELISMPTSFLYSDNNPE